MTATHSNNKAAKAGRWLGHACWKLKRREKQFVAWLIRHHVPAGVAKSCIWLIRLIVLAVVLYFSFTVAVLIAALLIIPTVLVHADVSTHKKDEYEWRDGLLGYGMYNRDGVRIDPYDPDEEP